MARRALTARGQIARVVAIVPALMGIFLLGQGVLDRLGWRIDLTPERSYTMSDRLRQIVGELGADLRLVAFQRSQDPRNARTREILNQIERTSARVRIEIVDVNRNPAFARQFAVSTSGGMVVESGTRRRVISVVNDDVLAAAMLQVTRQERRTVGWVVGHGEGDIQSNDREHGWSLARRALEAEWYEVRPVALATDPLGDMAALVIADPRKDLLETEVLALERFLRAGGALLVLLHPDRAPRLVQALGRYGVVVGDDVVVDPSGRLNEGERVTMRLAIMRDEHPILGPLDVPPLFSLTRSVAAGDGDGLAVRTQALLRTSPESWASRTPAAAQGAAVAFVEGRDRRGPIVVGLESTFEAPSDPGQPLRQGRVIVYGNAEFGSNFFFDYLGNKDLLVNTVAWLSREGRAIGQRARARELGREQFFVSAEDGRRTFWALGVLEPAVFAAVGVILALRRRRG